MLPSALGVLTALNGQLLVVETASPTQFTALVPLLANGTDTTGTFTSLSTQDYRSRSELLAHRARFGPRITPTGTPLKWWELTVKNNLSLESSKNRPLFLGPQTEDANGNITFRLASSPDKPYPVSIHVQLAAPAITSMNQTWAPLSDFMEYIYEWGFMALMWQFADDPRSQVANSNFKAGILARAEGLTEEERNIFLNNWEALYQNPQAKQMGTQARGV